MKISIGHIEKQWDVDAKIDRTDLSADSSRQLELHNKYHKLLNYLRRERRMLQADKARLTHLKTDYYSNQLPPQQLKELGWQPNQRLIIKADMERMLEADEDMIQLNLQLGDVNDMVEYVDSIIRNIHQKSFITRNIIENQKFVNGIN
jgi:competence CoiA-like predicted nuclease